MTKENKVKQYKVTLKVNDRELKASADTLEEALFNVIPDQFKTKGVVTIEYGRMKLERLLNVQMMRRIFNQRLSYREIAAKWLKIFLK